MEPTTVAANVEHILAQSFRYPQTSIRAYCIPYEHAENSGCYQVQVPTYMYSATVLPTEQRMPHVYKNCTLVDHTLTYSACTPPVALMHGATGSV